MPEAGPGPRAGMDPLMPPVEPASCWCGGRDYRKLFSAKGRRIARCVNCGQVRALPVPELNLSSAEEYQRLAQYYTPFGDQFRYYNRHFLNWVENEIGPERGRLLELGAGAGFLLEIARAGGWEPLGIEPSRIACNFINQELGLQARPGFLANAGLEPDSFQLVIMNHVLEHIGDLQDHLREIRRVLRPGGWVAIAVPNFDCASRRLLRGWWPKLMPDQHVWQFEPETLNSLFNRFGFKTRKIYPHNDRIFDAQASFARRLKIKVWKAMRWFDGREKGENLYFLATKSEIFES